MKSSREKTIREEVKGTEIASPQRSWAAKICSLPSCSREGTSPDFVLSLNKELFNLRRWSNGKMMKEVRKKWNIKRRRPMKPYKRPALSISEGGAAMENATLDNRGISHPFFPFFPSVNKHFHPEVLSLYSIYERVWILVVPTTCLLSLQYV